MSFGITQTIDVRAIIPRERHSLIFSSFDALNEGQAIQLVNDHDPRPLHYQFNSRCPGQFAWTYLQTGPDLWRVQISKLAIASAAEMPGGSCCSGGACGGG